MVRFSVSALILACAAACTSASEPVRPAPVAARGMRIILAQPTVSGDPSSDAFADAERDRELYRTALVTALTQAGFEIVAEGAAYDATANLTYSKRWRPRRTSLTVSGELTLTTNGSRSASSSTQVVEKGDRAESAAADALTAALVNSLTASKDFAALPQTLQDRPIVAREGAKSTTSKVFIGSIHHSGKVDPGVADVVGRMAAVRLSRVYAVSTYDDVKATLDLEKQKDLLGCDAASCMSDIGGALGADFVVYGGVTSVGSKYSISMNAIATRSGAVIARLAELTPGNEDSLTQKLPSMLDQLAEQLAQNGR